MKTISKYFGNRLAAVRSKRAQARAAQAAAEPTIEMEALESRILLSGLGSQRRGTFNFFDADGDKVSVSVFGKGATFEIDLGGAKQNKGGVDASEIVINGTNPNTSLAVVVRPVGSFVKPVATRPIFDPNFAFPPGLTDLELDKVNIQQKIQTQYYNLTPGYTNIGVISAGPTTTQIGSISLTAAVVPVIDLPGVAVGNINLTTGQVAKVDAFMATNGSYLPGYPGWIPGLGEINFYDINAKSIGGINLVGSPLGVNNFLGNITVEDGIGRLTGTNSAFFGQISLTGANSILGNVVLGGGFGPGAAIDAAGDLTFNAANFTGLLAVDGHLNLAIRGGLFDGTIMAGNGISGLRPGTADPIFFTNSNIYGQILSGGDISDIILTASTLGGGGYSASIVASGTIGNIVLGDGSFMTDSTIEGAGIGVISSLNTGVGIGTGNSFITPGDFGGVIIRNANLDNTNVLSVGGNFGLIDISNGSLNGNIIAGSFGDVILRGNGTNNADLTGILKSTVGDIGSVTVHFGNITGTIASAADINSIQVEGGSFNGAATAANDIGLISANWLDANKAGNGIGAAATIHAGNDILIVSGSSTNGSGVAAGANIRAEGDFGALIGTSFAGGAAGIGAASLVASSIGSVNGISVDNIGVLGLTVSSTTGGIGPVSGSGLSAGIANLKASAATELTSVTGSGVNNYGIYGSRLVADTIGNVTGTADFGIGIVYTDITATGSATLGDIFGSGDLGGILSVNATSASSIGDVSGIATGTGGVVGQGSGISGSNFVAGTSIGSISGESFSTAAGDAGLYNVNASAVTTIGAISGIGAGASGIIGGQFITQQGDITSALGKSFDANGSGSGIYGAKFISQSGFVDNITGYAAGTGAGLFGVIVSAETNVNDVTGTSLFGTGIGGSLVYAATGNIANVLGQSLNAQGAGDGIVNSTIRAELGSIDTVIGKAAGLVGGNGLDTVDVFAAVQGANALEVRGWANGGDGIAGGGTNVLIAEGDLFVQGKTVTGTAISGGTFAAPLGTLTIDVSATGQNANGIANANFSAASLAPITVNLPSSQAGTAIYQSTFTATNGSIGKIDITNNSSVFGGGIIYGTFTAVGGDIGGVTVNMTGLGDGVLAGTGDAIYGSSFTATGSIVDGAGNGVVVNSHNGRGMGGNSINPSTFAADSNNDGIGLIGNIAVTVTGPGGNGIVGSGAGPVTFSGASIGNLAVVVQNSGGGQGINYANFTATKGTIGDIEITNNGTGAGAVGAYFGFFTAETGIGTVEINSVGGPAFQASSLVVNNGNLGDFSATSATSSAVLFGFIDTPNGNIASITANAGAGFGFAGTATAGGSIGDIEANVNDPAGANAIFTLGPGIVAGTTIGAITVNSAATGNYNTVTGAIIAGDGIGAINIISNAGTGYGALTAAINADANGGNKLGVGPVDTGILTSITIQQNGLGDGIGATGAGPLVGITAAKIGDIEVTLNNTKAGTGIHNAAFTAKTNTETAVGSNQFNNLGEIGNISVLIPNYDGSGGKGAGIVSAVFNAGDGGAGIGNILVTQPSASGAGAANGITGTSFNTTANPTANATLFTSSIGTTTVVNTSGGTAVGGAGAGNVVYIANDGVGAFNIIAQATGMQNVNIAADADGDNLGDINGVTVMVTGVGATANGILGGVWTGWNVQPVTVDFNNPTPAVANDGIRGTNIAAANNIGAISVGVNNNPAGNNGIDGVNFLAANNLGAITVNAQQSALTDASGLLSIVAGNNAGAISLTSQQGSAFDLSNFGASAVAVTNDLASFQALSLGTTGAQDAVLGAAPAPGHIALAVGGALPGGITVDNASTNAAADGMFNVKFNILGALGPVSVTAAGGAAMNAAEIDPTTIDSIVLTGPTNAMINNSLILASGAVGSLTINGNVQVGSAITVGSITNPATITGDFAGNLTTTAGGVTLTSTGLIGNVIASGSATLNAATTIGNVSVGDTSSLTAGTSIGNVTGTGATSMTLTLNAPTVGKLDFNSLPAGQNLSLSLNAAVTSLGNITVANGGMSSGGSTTLTTLGSVTTGQQLTGGAVFGNAVTGLTGGALNINTSAAGGANAATFTFNNAPAVAEAGVPFVFGAPPDTQASNGLTVNLV